MSRDRDDEPEILPQGQQRFTWYNEDGDEVSHVFPVTNEVCDHCEGYGTHLNPSIGNHAYTMEEFHESFDEEEAQEYFRRGGRYDVQCEVCHGAKVVPVVDEKKLTAEQKKLFEEYCESEEESARMDAEDRHTRWMEDGCPSDRIMSTPTQLGAVFGLAILLCIFLPMTAILGVVTWFHPWCAIGFVCGVVFCLNLFYRLYQAGRS